MASRDLNSIDSTKKAPNVFFNAIDETQSSTPTTFATHTHYTQNTPTATIPVVNFTGLPIYGYAPLSVQFTDLSTGTPTVWNWDFDNSGTIDSTLQNPLYVYSDPGTYSVKLTASNELGPASLVKYNYITVVQPTVYREWWGQSIESTLYTDYVGTFGQLDSNWYVYRVLVTRDIDGNVLTYEPDTGIDTPSITFTPAFVGGTSPSLDLVDALTGTWNINIPVLSRDDPMYSGTFVLHGENSTNLINDVYLVDGDVYLTSVWTQGHPAPVTNFFADTISGTAPLLVNFTDSTLNFPNAWHWDFKNNGATDSILQNPSYTYTSPGLYNVKLTAYNSYGSTPHIKTNYINVSPAPPFDPLSIPDMVGWYDPSNALTITYSSGNLISEIADLSPQINNYSWSAGGQISIDSSHANLPLDAQYFSALNSPYLSPSNTGVYSSGFTLFAVSYWPGYNGESGPYGSIGVSQTLVNSGADIGIGTGSTATYIISGVNNLAYIGFNTKDLFGQSHGIATSPGSVSVGKHLVTVASGSTLAETVVNLDTISQSYTVSGTGGLSAACKVETGTWTQSAVYIPVGNLGEIIYYGRKLTPTEISNVETYLSTKWGIS